MNETRIIDRRLVRLNPRLRGALLFLGILTVIEIVYSLTIVPLILNNTLTSVTGVLLALVPIAAVIGFPLGGLIVLSIDMILTKEGNE